MDVQQQVVIRGRYVNGAFYPDGPSQMIEGPAVLVVTPTPQPVRTGSIFDHVGKASVLRSKEDIDAQIKEERDSWGEP